ncbi:MAG: STAS domain-containing protein [Ruminococcus sp.]|nr:STAS domain-containing protein [Ruminococcus sp.]
MNKTFDNNTTILTVSGRVDTTTTPMLETEIRASYDECNALVVDFTDVKYVSSAGLRILLSAHKVMSKKGGLRVTGVSDEIMEVFDITGFSTILNIEKKGA